MVDAQRQAEATEKFNQQVASYVRSGYEVTASSPTSAALVKHKKFSLFWFLVGLLLFGVPGLLYLAWYMAKRDEVVYLYLEADGDIKRKSG